jgi:hypothetical protein
MWCTLFEAQIDTHLLATSLALPFVGATSVKPGMEYCKTPPETVYLISERDGSVLGTDLEIHM